MKKTPTIEEKVIAKIQELDMRWSLRQAAPVNLPLTFNSGPIYTGLHLNLLQTALDFYTNMILNKPKHIDELAAILALFSLENPHSLYREFIFVHHEEPDETD